MIKDAKSFDRFVEKEWHFHVNSDACLEAQKYLKNYCQIEYSFQPPIKMTFKTYSGAKKNGGNVNGTNSSQKNETTTTSDKPLLTTKISDSAPRTRPIATKSTAKGPLVNSTLKTYSRKDMGTQFRNSKDSSSIPSDKAQEADKDKTNSDLKRQEVEVEIKGSASISSVQTEPSQNSDVEILEKISDSVVSAPSGSSEAAELEDTIVISDTVDQHTASDAEESASLSSEKSKNGEETTQNLM